jgi:hypothetical protein
MPSSGISFWAAKSESLAMDKGSIWDYKVNSSLSWSSYSAPDNRFIMRILWFLAAVLWISLIAVKFIKKRMKQNNPL